MPPDPATIGFRPVTENDLPMLERWLSAPHVAAWWDAPQESVRKIADHIGDPTVDPLLVELKGEPFAYIQICDLDAERDNEPALRGQPDRTVGLDQFIGPEAMTGRGLGPRFMRLAITDVFETGAMRVLVDPHPDNRNAVRAYEKTGFRRLGVQKMANGPALFMAIDRQEYVK